jgi:hypothetical protein
MLVPVGEVGVIVDVPDVLALAGVDVRQEPVMLSNQPDRDLECVAMGEDKIKEMV